MARENEKKDMIAFYSFTSKGLWVAQKTTFSPSLWK
jgi:hypothetical protein